MSIAKIIEVSAASQDGLEAAVENGLAKVASTLTNLQGAWISEIKVRTDQNGNVKEWRVCMRVSFIVEDHDDET